MSETKDCVVIGGGPAGSAFAGIAAKAAPEASIVVLEKARFPRWRIGESTIPVANTVLRELGVFETLFNGGAIKKLGICFVWGKDRVPWNADYLKIADTGPELGSNNSIDVLGQDLSAFSQRFSPNRMPFVAFNVDRARFDQLLLQRARELGAECREGVAVTEILRQKGAVCGVRYLTDRGVQGVIETPFVLDASGLSALLTRGEGRIRDPQMNNFAVYGYFSGAQWKSTFEGTRDATTIFIASVPLGWIWYFPIGQDVMSVGFVTHRSHFREQLQNLDLEGLYRQALESCPELSALLENASLRDDILPQGKRVHTSQDWSSWAKSPVGPGWAAAGDAAVFVDPILSSGVTLALQSGHRAACTWITARRRPELGSDPLWRAYADYLRGEAFSFLKLARFFYGNNHAAESWWWEAQRLLNARGRLELEPHRAFTMATAGFFPVPRAIGLEVLAPLIAGATGSEASLMSVYDNPGLEVSEISPDALVTPLSAFRLALRTEPRADRPETLDVYHDLVTDDPETAHRISVFPSRIAPALAPVVVWMQEPIRVSELIARAQAELASTDHGPEAIRRVTLELVRRAVIKGFVLLETPCDRASGPGRAVLYSVAPSRKVPTLDEQKLRQFGGLIVRLQQRQDLSREEARDAYLQIWRNQQPELQQGALISALRAKGETLEELLGVTESHNIEWLSHCSGRVEAPEPHLGIIGTGMDSLKTANISSGAAIVAAACGLYVHKVGAPGMTGVSGSADAFSVLGVDADASVERILGAVRSARLGFTSGVGKAAQRTGMYRVLGQMRCGTTVHLAGPLGFHSEDERRKVLGVSHPAQVPAVAEVMRQMGYERGLVPCGGSDEHPDRFMDEFSTLGVTQIAELRDGKVRQFQFRPEEAGLKLARYADVTAGSTREENLSRLARVLSGRDDGPLADLICLNAAFCLLLMDKVSHVREGVELGRRAVHSGKAVEQLKQTIRAQNQNPDAGLAQLDRILASS